MDATHVKSIVEQLRAAREGKGLSQRALAERVGIPQGHISRIENATVDLQVSSLIQIARALDLELMLVPRSSLPAMQALARPRPANETPVAANNRARLDALRVQVTKLVRRFPETVLLKRLLQTILELRQLPLEMSPQWSYQFLVTVEEIRRVMSELSSQPAAAGANPDLIKQSGTLERALQGFRGIIAYGQVASPVTPTPAYTLDDETSND